MSSVGAEYVWPIGGKLGQRWRFGVGFPVQELCDGRLLGFTLVKAAKLYMNMKAPDRSIRERGAIPRSLRAPRHGRHGFPGAAHSSSCNDKIVLN